MALKWQYRSDSATQARYATGLRDMSRLKSLSALTLTSGPTGTFGGTYLDMTAAPVVIWPGHDNGPVGATAISVLMRVIPVNSGNPAATKCLFSMGHNAVDNNDAARGSFFFSIGTNGFLTVNAGNNAGSSYLSPGRPFSAGLTFVANTPIDIWFVWNGSSAANSCKCYAGANGVAATLIGTASPGLAMAAMTRAAMGTFATYDPSWLVTNNVFHINEIAVFDTAFDPGAVYGARADFITAAAYEGYNSTALNASQVALNVAFGPGPGSSTGSLVVGTPPATTDVREGTNFIDNTGATLTGSLHVPATYTGTSSLVNFAQIKENLKYYFEQANTTTANFDLSNGLDTRVKRVTTLHPQRIMLQPSWYPYVTMYVEAKDIELKDMAINQKNAKRSHRIRLKVVGGVWNSKAVDKTKDYADTDCEQLMENVEEIIRRNPTLDGQCLWQAPSGVTYHNKAVDEEANLRIGILTLDIMVHT